MLRGYSITKKLTAMNLLVSTAALLTACAAFVVHDRISFRDTLAHHLSIQAQIAGANSVAALLFSDRPAAEKTLSALKAAPNIVSAVIYMPDGHPFAAYQRDSSGRIGRLPAIPPGQTEAYWFRSDEVELARRIVFQNQTAGIVCIRSDLRELNDRLQRYLGIAALVLLVSLVAALVVSSAFQRTITEPILHLSQVARIVSRDKKYAIRAAPTGHRDETAILIASFNEMLTQIQTRDEALQKAHDELEARVKDRTAQLAMANKELEAFSYSVAHDLRAPLRQIDGFSRVLAEGYGSQLDPTAQRYLKLVSDGARNMGQLVDDLLSMGQIARQEPVRKLTDLNSLLQGIVRELQPEGQDRQIDWRIGALPRLECDAGLMKIAFTNLLSNAVKYTRRRERAVIEVGLVLQAGSSAIFVRDNGAGFEQQFAHKLFGVFQRLHRTEEFEGTGVGLATVQRIIQKHNGRIWAEGEVGKGATFFFSLPVMAHGLAMPVNSESLEVTYGQP